MELPRRPRNRHLGPPCPPTPTPARPAQTGQYIILEVSVWRGVWNLDMAYSKESKRSIRLILLEMRIELVRHGRLTSFITRSRRQDQRCVSMIAVVGSDRCYLLCWRYDICCFVTWWRDTLSQERLHLGSSCRSHQLVSLQDHEHHTEQQEGIQVDLYAQAPSALGWRQRSGGDTQTLRPCSGGGLIRRKRRKA